MNPDSDTLELIYDLFDLPTSQHKAGLAGLLVLVESMRRRRINPLPGLDVAQTRARVVLTRESIQSLLDELYDASVEEVTVRTPWKGKPCIREEMGTMVDKKTGQEKKVKLYVYPQPMPKASFLEGLQLSQPWVKLWRDVVWSTLRGIPKTRTPFNQRIDGSPVQEANKLWDEMVKSQADKQKNRLRTAEVSSSIFIGAQARNAEQVPFLGRPDQNFLLHFWPIVMTCWLPKQINQGGEESQPGYVLAVPDVADLEEFIEEYLKLLPEKDPALAGFRPREAFISLPEEGALELMRELMAITRAKAGRTRLRYSIAGVEVFHLEKHGNSIHQLFSGAVGINSKVLESYETVRKEYHNPAFKSQLIRNLLSERPWYDGFIGMFVAGRAELFIRSADTPMTVAGFAQEVKDKFLKEIEDGKRREKANMSEKDSVSANPLSTRIYSIIRSYVRRKTELKSGITWKSFENNKDANNRIIIPEEYHEACQKVCLDAFLAIRGRRSREDFASYFTGTICSVPQYLPEAEYMSVTDALLTEKWEDVRNLSMLALSAQSYV